MKVPEIPEPTRLSIVIPAYNEERTLATIVSKVLAVPYLFEVIIVNDNSTDGTAKIADELATRHEQVRVIHQAKNLGKSQALKAGFAQTTGDIVIVQDADAEYDPAEIPSVIQPIIDGHADVVYGSRFLVRNATRVLYFYHYLGNRFLTFLSNLFTNLNMTDIETCYKAFRGDLIRNLDITSGGFGFEVEVTAKVAKLRCPIYEVPISYYGRTYEEGKKIGMVDGIAALWLIIRYNLFSGRQSSAPALPPSAVGSKSAYPLEEAIPSRANELTSA